MCTQEEFLPSAGPPGSALTTITPLWLSSARRVRRASQGSRSAARLCRDSRGAPRLWQEVVHDSIHSGRRDGQPGNARKTGGGDSSNRPRQSTTAPPEEFGKSVASRRIYWSKRPPRHVRQGPDNALTISEAGVRSAVGDRPAPVPEFANFRGFALPGLGLGRSQAFHLQQSDVGAGVAAHECGINGFTAGNGDLDVFFPTHGVIGRHHDARSPTNSARGVVETALNNDNIRLRLFDKFCKFASRD